MPFNSNRARGQTMVETALSIPFLLLILISVLYFGRYFYIQSVVSFAVQQGAILAARTPNLQDPAVRDAVRGFTTDGEVTSTSSVMYNILSSASLLSQGKQGNLPTDTQIVILPYDAGTAVTPVPPGALAVQIRYPFHLLGSNAAFNGPLSLAMSPQATPMIFPNLNITEQAATFPQVY